MTHTNEPPGFPGRFKAFYVVNWNGSSWAALGEGSGVVGNVFALAVQGDDVYVGGDFAFVGNVSANHIARWDGNSWSALGSGGGNGVNSTVRAITVHDGSIYVGGFFTEANVGAPIVANRIARWDGASWSRVGSGAGNGVDNAIRAMASVGSTLFVGGLFTEVNVGAGISANRIAQWNGASWSAIGSGGGNGLNNAVLTIAEFEGELYVGGFFNQANVGAGIVANNIARWNGANWAMVGSNGGNGIDTILGIGALAVQHDGLYVGGAFAQVNMGAPILANNIARWDGANWSFVGASGLNNGTNGTVASMLPLGSDLYVGGFFSHFGGPAGLPANRIGRWDGSEWSSLGSGVSGNSVLALAGMEQQSLFVGGEIASAGGQVSSGIAKFDLRDSQLFQDGFE